MRFYLIFILFSFIIPNSWSQSNIKVVNLTTNEICNKLEKIESLKNLNKTQADSIIEFEIKKFNKEWKKQINKFPESDLKGLLTTNILLHCNNFWFIDEKLSSDLFYENKKYFSETQKTRYITVKKFLVDLLKENEVSSLKQKFKNNIQDTIIKDLIRIKKDLKEYTKNPIIDIFVSPGSNIFYTSIIDYMSNQKVIVINFQFNDENDLLIDDFAYFLYDELRKTDSELENIDLKNIPPPPPSPNFQK